jgi:hypothetical protein
MDTLQALALGEAHRDDPTKVFDWDKAAQLIKDRQAAAAGLSGDWEWTGGDIFLNGEPVPQADTYTYLASTWATPELDIDGEIIDCWRYKSDSPDWDAETYWPDSALAILISEPS